MKEKRFIVVEPGGDISKWLFSELEDQPNVDILYKPTNISNTFLRKVKKAHFSRKINHIVNIPFKRIWDRYYTLSSYDFLPQYEYYIIVGNFAICEFDLEYLEKIRKKHNAKIVLLFTDSICSEHAKRAYDTTQKFKYDYVYTFDPKDAKEYGFLYTGPLYSYKPIKRQEIVRDLYFVGVNKNRLSILREIYNKLTNKGVTCDFYVAGVPKGEISNDGIIYNERCSYEQVIDRIQKYNVILDIVQEGQTGATFRYFEAVCYNKKLITNNRTIKNYPFYSPDNMLVFDDIDEIDSEWIHIPAKEYGYRGEFSPVNWINRIGE